jgi:diphthine-ammonia ligase
MNQSISGGGAATTVMLWTGGKDSALAFEAVRRDHHKVRELATFVPQGGRFLAHPLNLMDAQATSIGLPHRRVVIRPPYKDGYESVILQLREQGVTTLVTGDISEVDGQENWILERAQAVGVKVRRPLWHRERRQILEDMLDWGIQAVITAAREPPLGPHWVGRNLDRLAVNQLQELSSMGVLDLCGEQGEYHTVVFNSPSFRTPIQIPSFARNRVGNLHYADFHRPGTGSPGARRRTKAMLVSLPCRT